MAERRVDSSALDLTLTVSRIKLQIGNGGIRGIDRRARQPPGRIPSRIPCHPSAISTPRKLPPKSLTRPDRFCGVTCGAPFPRTRRVTARRTPSVLLRHRRRPRKPIRPPPPQQTRNPHPLQPPHPPRRRQTRPHPTRLPLAHRHRHRHRHPTPLAPGILACAPATWHRSRRRRRPRPLAARPGDRSASGRRPRHSAPRWRSA